MVKNVLNRRDVINILFLIFAWAIMVTLVNPVGDFPLNDDWAYGQTVKSLLYTGNFQLSDWTATNLLSQTLWGTLFCLPVGFSFTALRLSTLVLGLIGILATYGLLRSTNAEPDIAIMGAMLIAVNPIYFGLSHTFMPDIPFFSLGSLSCYFFILGWKHSSRKLLITGLIVNYINLLSRQASLIFFIAFGCAYIIKNEKTFKNFIRFFSPTILGIFLQLIYQNWLLITMNRPALYGNQINLLLENVRSQNPMQLIFLYVSNLLIIFIYMGLFLLPFSMILAKQSFAIEREAKKIQAKGFFFLAILSVSYISLLGAFRFTGQKMPLIGNILTDIGIGPASIKGYFLESRIGHLAVKLFQISLNHLTILGSILLVFIVVKILISNIKIYDRGNQDYSIAIKVFLVSSVILYALSFSGLNTKFWFDRYLLILMPLLMALLIFSIRNNFDISISRESPKKLNSAFPLLASLLILFYGVFSIMSTHDYLLANRVRWHALNELMQVSQVTPSEIDGGFEFNGWYFGQSLEACNPNYQPTLQKSMVSWGDFSCLWENDNSLYTVSFSPLNGYQIINEYTVNSWLPFNMKRLFISKRDD